MGCFFLGCWFGTKDLFGGRNIFAVRGFLDFFRGRNEFVVGGTSYFLLHSLYFFSDVETSRVVGEDAVGPDSLSVLGSLWVTAGLQNGDLDQVLGILSLVAGQEVVSHGTEVPAPPVVTLMVAPP